MTELLRWEVCVFSCLPLSNFTQGDILSNLRTRIPEIASLCDELFSMGIPHTLVHGDLHLSNINVSNNAKFYRILDWGSAFVGHPLCDFAVFCAMNDISPERWLTVEHSYFPERHDYWTIAQLR